MAPVSWKLPGSNRRSIRSRTVSRPLARWRSTRSSPPMRRASSSRRRSSSSSGSQLMPRAAYARPLSLLRGWDAEEAGALPRQPQVALHLQLAAHVQLGAVGVAGGQLEELHSAHGERHARLAAAVLLHLDLA